MWILIPGGDGEAKLFPNGYGDVDLGLATGMQNAIPYISNPAAIPRLKDHCMSTLHNKWNATMIVVTANKP